MEWIILKIQAFAMGYIEAMNPVFHQVSHDARAIFLIFIPLIVIFLGRKREQYVTKELKLSHKEPMEYVHQQVKKTLFLPRLFFRHRQNFPYDKELALLTQSWHQEKGNIVVLLAIDYLSQTFPLKPFNHKNVKKVFKQVVNAILTQALRLKLWGHSIKIGLQHANHQVKKTSQCIKQKKTKQLEKVIANYETKLQGTTAASILYLMGLFDYPVSKDAIRHLRQAKIPQLTDQLENHSDWVYALDGLRQQRIVNDDNPKYPNTIAAHPLVRKYFAKRLKQQAPKAWQQAHQTLYHYYKDLPETQASDTVEQMQPLFSAIAHGCAAGMYQQALEEIYWPRIQRKGDNYLCNKLGAFNTDLSTISHFFTQRWHRPAESLSDDDKALVLNWAAFRLRALGRLQEAVKPFETALTLYESKQDAKESAIAASNLSELQLTRGELSLALTAAKQSVIFADQSGDLFYRMSCRTTLTDTLHQLGEHSIARQGFEMAERLQQQWQADYPQLYALQGFQYCDLLLTTGKWKEVQQRAQQTLKRTATHQRSSLSTALDHLSLGRACLQQVVQQLINRCTLEDTHRPLAYEVLLIPFHHQPNQHKQPQLAQLTHLLGIAKDWLDQAIIGLRKSGQKQYLPLGLLARARYYRIVTVVKHYTDSPKHDFNAALNDLKETYEIALQSGMRLHLCDYYLEVARLALNINRKQPQQSTYQYIKKAQQLINDTGYKRRLPELEYLVRKIKCRTKNNPAMS
ncbi:MAG: hypothetical protein KAG28_07530 [Cocleimonas sp.]|nr:hypothetical protein [Cocleimonas sp.]